ncbi:hypothetical protein N0V90_007883 [Kalmusia sp. IMI 367209]|nr:hypothetical protein N0V90_007883 [Kalmusia sp. IMI 367209]
MSHFDFQSFRAPEAIMVPASIWALKFAPTLHGRAVDPMNIQNKLVHFNATAQQALEIFTSVKEKIKTTHGWTEETLNAGEFSAAVLKHDNGGDVHLMAVLSIESHPELAMSEEL